MSRLTSFISDFDDEQSLGFDSFSRGGLNVLTENFYSQGSISSSFDRDYYTINLGVGSYTIAMTSDASRYGYSTFNDSQFLQFDITDFSGNVLLSSQQDFSKGSLFDDVLDFTSDSFGTFYVEVYDTFAFSGADYAIELISNGSSGGFTPAPTNTAPVAGNDTATATAGQSVTISIGSNDSDADGDSLTTTGFTNPSKGTVSYTENTFSADTVRYTPFSTATGTDSFRYQVSDGNGGTDTATVTITISAADIGENTSTTGRVVVGGSVNSDHTTSDFEDWFAVSLTAGTKYSFHNQGSDTGSGTMADPYLQLYDGSGVFINGDDDSGIGLNAQLTYTPTTTGTHYIASTSTTINNFSTGTYTLSVTEGIQLPTTASGRAVVVANIASDAVNSPQMTWVPFPESSSNEYIAQTSGTFDAINVAHYVPVIFEQGHQYDILLSSGVEPAIFINDGEGHSYIGLDGDDIGIPDRTDIPTDSVYNFTPDFTGLHYMNIGPATVEGLGVQTNYTLSIQEDINPERGEFNIFGAQFDRANNSSSILRASVGDEVLSFLGDGSEGSTTSVAINGHTDEDYVHVDLIAGQTYEVRISANTLTLLQKPYRGEATFEGRIINWDQDTDAVFTHTASNTGSHALLLKGAFSDSSDFGAGGVYKVSVSSTNTNPVSGTTDKTLLTSEGLRTSLDISNELGSNNLVISSNPSNGNVYAYDKSSLVFDTAYYFSTNPNAVNAVASGFYSSAEDYFYNAPKQAGDTLNPNAIFSLDYYLINNADVVIGISQGAIANAFTHYQTIGVYEGRLPSSIAENDSFVYVPNENFIGTDTFTYSITDATGNSIDQVTVDVSVIDDTNNVFRFFNTDTSTHFYSSSVVERDSILLNMPHFTLEGPSFKAADPTNPAADTVFRFFNTQTGTHFFTQSTVERDNILDTLPQFSFEGEAYKGYTEEVAGSTPLYRFFNTDTGTHFYTAAEAEKDSIIANLPSFNFEGTAYWVDPVMG